MRIFVGSWSGCLSKLLQNVGGPKNTLLLDNMSINSGAIGLEPKEKLFYDAHTQHTRARVCGRECFNGID